MFVIGIFFNLCVFVKYFEKSLDVLVYFGWGLNIGRIFRWGRVCGGWWGCGLNVERRKEEKDGEICKMVEVCRFSDLNFCKERLNF